MNPSSVSSFGSAFLGFCPFGASSREAFRGERLLFDVGAVALQFSSGCRHMLDAVAPWRISPTLQASVDPLAQHVKLSSPVYPPIRLLSGTHGCALVMLWSRLTAPMRGAWNGRNRSTREPQPGDTPAGYIYPR